MAQNGNDKTTKSLIKDKYPMALLWVLISSLLVFICIILAGCYFAIDNVGTLSFNFAPDSIADFTGNHINGSVDLKSESNSPWWILMPYAVVVCAVAFILSKTISAIRDLIENEQVNYRYTQQK